MLQIKHSMQIKKNQYYKYTFNFPGSYLQVRSKHSHIPGYTKHSHIKTHTADFLQIQKIMYYKLHFHFPGFIVINPISSSLQLLRISWIFT